MNPTLSRIVLYSFAVLCLSFCLSALPWLPPAAQAADISVSGGGGGGGGGGNGAYQNSLGSNASYLGGLGGAGGSGAPGSGNAGGGGGASGINGAFDTARNGGNASGVTPGTAGATVEAGETAGAAGSANSGNVGGAGGSGASAAHTSSATSADTIYVYAGNGGRGGQGGTNAGYAGGDGGDGGSASLTLTGGTMAVAGNVLVGGGQGANGTSNSVGSGASGNGGTGGAASLSISGALTANSVQVYSGGNGIADGYGALNPGTGGNVGFFATSLAAQVITLAKNPGNLAFNVGTLDVTGGNTTLNLMGTTAGTAGTAMNGDGVYIGTARLGDGQLVVTAPFFPYLGDAAIDTLQLEGSGAFFDALNYATVGSLTVNGGTLNNANWSGLIDHAYTTPDITLGAGGATVELGAGQDKTLARDLIGSGALTKTGAGTLTLSGANTYSGGTTVSAGTLAGNTASLQGAITNNAAVLFNQTAAGTYAGIMSGGGSLIKDGAGTLTLSGANTYTGLTEVRTGTLALSGAGSISNQLALYDGTTFDTGSAAPYAALNQLDVLGSTTWTGSLDMTGKAMNFYIPTTMGNGATMLNVSGTADVTGSTVNVGIDGSSSPLQAGNQIQLINAVGGLTGTPANTTANGQGMQGVTLKYEFGISTQGSQLLANVTSAPTVNEQTKALSEGWLSGAALINQGADLIAGKGMSEAVRAARAGVAGGMGLGVFGALSGGWSRYNSGSHVDMSSLSLLAGLSWGADMTPGRLTLGAFFEYGKGSYDTYNSFSNAASVHGNGDTYHMGGGVLGRMDFINTGPGHIYTEASFRAGSAHNEYSSGDLRDSTGRKADYDSSSAYYGLHFGAGYVWEITDKASLDLYGKYFWTRQEGDSVKLSTGDPVTFKDVDSSRLRVGSRFAYALNEYVSPYIGAAYEHEFDGRARASTNGFAIDAPSLRGDTGIGELGLTLKPSQTLPLSFDLGVQGYVGRREGVTGTLQAKWEF